MVARVPDGYRTVPAHCDESAAVSSEGEVRHRPGMCDELRLVGATGGQSDQRAACLHSRRGAVGLYPQQHRGVRPRIDERLSLRRHLSRNRDELPRQCKLLRGLRLLAKGEATPGAIVTISPWCDLTVQNPAIADNADKDITLSGPILERF